MSQPNDQVTRVTPPSLPGKPAKAVGRFGFSRVLVRWWWLGSLAVIAATIVVSMIPGWLNVRGPLYESKALVEVKPIMPIHTGSSTVPVTKNFINTQLEIITAQETLNLALEKEDLLVRLGGDRRAAIDRMRDSILTNRRGGTDLISISYRDEDRELAHIACTAVYEAYHDRRNELEMKVRREQLNAIKVELQNKKDRVAELRKRLMDIAEKMGIIWVENEDGNITHSDTRLRKLAEQKLVEAEKEKVALELQIQKLLKVEDVDLPTLAAELPDVGFKEVYKKYEEAKIELAKAKASGLSERHPDIVMRNKRIEEMRKALLKRVVNIRESLKHRHAIAEKRLQATRELIRRNRDEGSAQARSFQDINIARKDYETARHIADQLQIKHNIEEVKLTIPPTNIIVHQTPELPSVPVTRGREFVTVVGTLASLPLSIIGGLILMFIAEAVFPRRGA